MKYDDLFQCDLDSRNLIIPIGQQNNLVDTENVYENFNYKYAKFYKKISCGLVNTHIDYRKSGKQGNHIYSNQRLFIKLQWWQRLRMKYMFNEWLLQKDPIQYSLLIIAITSLLLNGIIQVSSGQLSDKRAIENKKLGEELIQVIEKKKTNPQILNIIEQQDTVVILIPKSEILRTKVIVDTLP